MGMRPECGLVVPCRLVELVDAATVLVQEDLRGQMLWVSPWNVRVNPHRANDAYAVGLRAVEDVEGLRLWLPMESALPYVHGARRVSGVVWLGSETSYGDVLVHAGLAERVATGTAGPA